MIGEPPKFLKSKYFVNEPGNWHLKDGAPAEVVKEFQEFMESLKHDAPTVELKVYDA